MENSVKLKLKSAILNDPNSIKEILLFMASVCREQWWANRLSTPANRAWAERERALLAIEELLREDNNHGKA